MTDLSALIAEKSRLLDRIANLRQERGLTCMIDSTARMNEENARIDRAIAAARGRLAEVEDKIGGGE